MAAGYCRLGCIDGGTGPIGRQIAPDPPTTGVSYIKNVTWVTFLI